MSERQKSQNDIAWEALFSKYNIVNQVEKHGRFLISAPQIKKYREPRLMAKFDHHINLPKIFTDHELAILPVSRGDYLISHFDPYHPLQVPEQTIIHKNLPCQLESLNPQNIPSEAIAINCALASGILEDFLEEEPLYATVSGRMGSGQFDFDIYHTKNMQRTTVEVCHSQIEIDAAFESDASLTLLEAKRELTEDFLVRQLYYPFRVWQNRVTKKIRPVFLVYSNGIYRMYEYEFMEPGYYHSLVLIKQKNYAIEDTKIELTDLFRLHSDLPNFAPEPEIPFPQADSFERVINLCELLESQMLTREQVTEEYAFNIRQTNYYSDAARYLGLTEKGRDGRKPFYSLSVFGRQIMNLNYKQRQLAFCKAILSHRVFYDTFSLCQDGVVPDRHKIISVMKQSNLYGISANNTFERRASTISGWLNWMLGLTKR